MKKLLIASLSAALLIYGVSALAEEAPPAAPTGATSAEAPPQAKGERKAMREKMKAEREAMRDKVKAACAADISVTGCTQELGKGLLKCVHAYKKTHKEFELSAGCKEVMHEGKEMRHDMKEAHQAMKDKKAVAPAEKK